MASGIQEKVTRSDISYNTYNGNYHNLYPGTWDVRFQKSTNDRVYTSRYRVANFRKGFTASKNLKSFSNLREEAFKFIGNALANNIYSFNPED